MEVLILFSLCVAAAEFSQDIDHVQAFVQQKGNLKKKYRPLYHISAPVGWLNSPAGFTYHKHRYHIFYQYHPYNGAWGSMQWGQVLSDNLVDWIHYPPAILPKDSYDRRGCFAGSTVVHNDYLTVFYTGKAGADNRTFHTQNMAISADGMFFQKYLYNPIIQETPVNTSDIRNPKVWWFRGNWYMILGGTSAKASNVKNRGQLLLYTSSDMFHWKYDGILSQSFGDMGYLWESPDIFELDGHHVLILSVRGIQEDSYRFRNLYQTGYVVGNFNYLTQRFENLEVSLATFMELDFGHDFYTAQTMRALDGRRLLIGWLGMWEGEFVESRDGWASMLTTVRELRLSSQGRLLSLPVREMEELRVELLEDAWYSPGEAFLADTRSFELMVNASTSMYDVSISFEWGGERQYSVTYLAERGSIHVDRSGTDGTRRADWAPVGPVFWRIFFDVSCVEVFVGGGEVVFTSRVYPKKGIRVRVGGATQLHITQYKMRRSVVYNRELRKYLKDNDS